MTGSTCVVFYQYGLILHYCRGFPWSINADPDNTLESTCIILRLIYCLNIYIYIYIGSFLPGNAKCTSGEYNVTTSNHSLYFCSPLIYVGFISDVGSKIQCCAVLTWIDFISYNFPNRHQDNLFKCLRCSSSVLRSYLPWDMPNISYTFISSLINGSGNKYTRTSNKKVR
jgi:hypothetical protein